MPMAISYPHSSHAGSCFFLEGRSEWYTSSIFVLLKLLEPVNHFLLLVVAIIIIIIIMHSRNYLIFHFKYLIYQDRIH